MPILITDNRIAIEESCPIEDAESLHAAIKSIAQPVFDLAGAKYLHTAAVQLILASGGAIVAPPPDPILASCLRHRITA